MHFNRQVMAISEAPESDTEAPLAPECRHAAMGSTLVGRIAAGGLGMGLLVGACFVVSYAQRPRGMLVNAQSAVGLAELAEPGKTFHPGWPCSTNEEIFFGNCFASCSNLTNGEFPYRGEDCTCCKSLPCSTLPGEFVTDCDKLKKDSKGFIPHMPMLPECAYENEELYQGLCYTKCSLLTRGQYPIRTGLNTCSNHKFGGNWTMGVGLCSGFGIGGTKCLPHIPRAAGAGFVQPANTKPGIAPLGFMDPSSMLLTAER
eukprot:gb/GFBE01037493.1/.p1 GENE.gb/GFBE01037493.1/~~gb/GFBE01037493.1/.p1  ORF type:complete len:259 (+),score=47.38 gb/GFBE01037493.1/:1-777(+)